MPLFEYKGVDAKSKNVSGTVDAESEKAARAKLRRQKIFPTKISQQGKGIKEIRLFKGVKVEEIANMTRQLSVLLNANIPLIEALEATIDQVENPEIRKALTDIKGKVSEGSRMGDCLAAYPKVFDNIYIYMVKAGESSGSLDVVLDRLALFKEGQADLKQNIQSAMIYPALMIFVSFGMLLYLFTSVVPKITSMLIKQKAALPLPTQIVMGITDAILNYWYFVGAGLIIFVLWFLSWKGSVKGRERIDKWRLTAPIIGGLSIKIAVSRFARTLSTLLDSGVQLLPGLEIVKNVLDNVVLAKVIENVMANVKEGESLADPLSRSGYFPAMFLHMIKVGEKTGQLEKMLEKVAANYDKEVDTYVKGLTSMLTPVMLIFMGGMIGLIVAAVLLPILEMQ
ncbi:MAG: type II secretion system F family protein [bacterium]|nr:type II secretion system F family protein [bacterium]MBU1917002.1 type II secretion system F family protein [bacterium]